MHVEDRLPLAELQRLERLEKNSSKAGRFRIVILAIHGYITPAIAMSVGLSRRICQRWVYCYNKLGFKGLEDLRKKIWVACSPLNSRPNSRSVWKRGQNRKTRFAHYGAVIFIAF
jgi:hypothetical protein